MSALNIPGIRLVPTPVLAQIVDDLDMARRQFQAGQAYYERGEYDEALGEFQKSYQLSRKAELYYNIALCYEKLLRFEEALEAYRNYLEGIPDAPDRQKVESRIAFLEGIIQGRQRPVEIPPPRRQTPPPTKPTKPPSPPPAKPIQTLSKPEAPVVEETGIEEGEMPYYRTLTWISFALSAIGLTAGTIYYYKAGDKKEEYENLIDRLMAQETITRGDFGDVRFKNEEGRAVYGDELRELEEDMGKFDNLAKLGFISGAVLAVGGGLFLWLDYRQSAQLKLEPRANGGALSLGVSF